MKTPEQIAANARERARRQNEKAKENWDIISCRLPKGTKERIADLGLTANGVINTAVLAYLDALESQAENLPQEPEKTAENGNTERTEVAEKVALMQANERSKRHERNTGADHSKESRPDPLKRPAVLPVLPGSTGKRGIRTAARI